MELTDGLNPQPRHHDRARTPQRDHIAAGAGASTSCPPTPGRSRVFASHTRKSSEEGLDQEFNSLDAQRESAEAYIASQNAEGWVAVPDQYYDGGFSGGSMERPALDRLLRDIANGKIECVVVYKVDRLSRSLMDFSRIMETFEKHNVSFVSVTQHFNTTHSMGRLIGTNRDCFPGARVLDIGAHDGRWGFAALQAGAEHVTMIEPRPTAVAMLRERFALYGVDPVRYDVVQKDVSDCLAWIAEQAFDMVLLLGFLYHTGDHLRLMQAIGRGPARTVVVDTEIVADDRPVIRYRSELDANARCT